MRDVAQKPKFPRWIKAVIWTASLLLAYTVLGFFIIPAVTKAQLLKRLPVMTKRQAAIRQVAFNPFTFGFALRGLALTETNGAAFAGFDEFHVQFQAMASLFHWSWVFHDVTLIHPSAYVVRLKDGSFNFDNLVETNAPPAAKPAKASGLPTVVVESLRVDGASLKADDLSPAAAFHDLIAPVNVQLTNFIIKINAASPYVFSATTDADEKFVVSGDVTVQPFEVTGNVKVTGLDLKRYGPYLPPFTTAQVIGGKLDAGADYQFAIGPKGPDATVTNGTVKLTDLRVKSPDSGETVVSIPTLTLDLAEASLARKVARVRSIRSSGGSLLVRQNHDGTINLLNLMGKTPPAAAPPVTSAAPAAASPPWTAQVDEIAFDGYGIAVEDQKPVRPVKLDVSALAFSIKGFNSATNSPLATAVSMHVNGQGSLSVKGTVAPAPFSGDLTLDLSGLELPPLAPYVPSQFNFILSKGQLNVQGRAQCALTSNGPAGSFAGDVSVKNLATADPVHDRDLIGFDALTVKGIKASYPEVKLQIEEVALVGLNASAIIDSNRQINLLSVVANNAVASNDPPKAAALPAPASPPAPAPQMDLAALVIEKASFHFRDQSLEPQATFDLQELSGTIKGLSTQPKGPAAVDIRGNVDQFSPFTVSGTVDPLSKEISLNLAVSFKNVELTSMSPYMEKYGGYPLNKGKLLLQLNYDVARRKLAATNQVEVLDLTLGARNESTNATHLPVKLGIALLKDRTGKITLDVPVSGSLDDPKFKLVSVIWGVVENLLAKAATSPFTLLGKVLGGSEQDLSAVDFAPGEAVLAPPERAKMGQLAKALYERPALTLQIAGACAPPVDSAVLARRHLQERIKRLRAEEEAAAGKTVESVEAMQLEPAEYARLLQKFYKRTFGTNFVPAAPSNSAPAAVKAPPGKAPELAAKTRGAGHFAKGGEKLMRYETEATLAAPGRPPSGAAPPASDVEEMERRLMADIPVTDGELRELAQKRARAAQSALLESGQVPAERVFILAPKPLSAGAAGQTRALFSLE